jgi:hypothetical protein
MLTEKRFFNHEDAPRQRRQLAIIPTGDDCADRSRQ